MAAARCSDLTFHQRTVVNDLILTPASANLEKPFLRLHRGEKKKRHNKKKTDDYNTQIPSDTKKNKKKRITGYRVAGRYTYFSVRTAMQAVARHVPQPKPARNGCILPPLPGGACVVRITGTHDGPKKQESPSPTWTPHFRF